MDTREVGSLSLLAAAFQPVTQVVGLKWTDVDFDAGTVLVKRTLSCIGIDKKKYPKGWKLTPPKTKKSRRTIPLPEIAIRELRKWKKLLAWERRSGARYCIPGSGQIGFRRPKSPQDSTRR